MGARKPPMMTGFQAEENLTGRAKKNVRKILDVIAISSLVNSLKGVSGRLIRRKGYPPIQKKLWGGPLWSPGYFAGSCGGAPISVLRQYIEAQRTPN